MREKSYPDPPRRSQLDVSAVREVNISWTASALQADGREGEPNLSSRMAATKVVQALKAFSRIAIAQIRWIDSRR